MPSQIDDGWDWPYIMYVGRVWLGYTSEEVWRLTPRQFKAQLDVHVRLNSRSEFNSEVTEGFIDNLNW